MKTCMLWRHARIMSITCALTRRSDPNNARSAHRLPTWCNEHSLTKRASSAGMSYQSSGQKRPSRSSMGKGTLCEVNL